MKTKHLLELGPAIVLPLVYLLFNWNWYHLVPALLIATAYFGILSMIRSSQEAKARRLASELEKAAPVVPTASPRKGNRPALSNLSTTAAPNQSKKKAVGPTESEIKLALSFGAVHSLILIIITVVAMGFLENSPWYAWNYDREEEAFYIHLADVTSSGAPQGYEKAIGEIKTRMNNVAPTKRQRLADKGFDYYLEWAMSMASIKDKNTVLGKAVLWSEADQSSGNPIKLDPNKIYKVKRMLEDTVPTPTPLPPTATPVPPPTATPVPPTRTPVPTVVPPTPTPLPGTLPLCDVPSGKEPVKVINLTQGIREQDSKYRSGKFVASMFFENPNIPVTIRPGDYVCLAGSEDGRRDWKVDDKASINVIHADGTESQIENLVKDSATGFPGLVKSLNATSLFKAGSNQVTIQLWDLIGDKYSSSPIWLVIWR